MTDNPARDLYYSRHFAEAIKAFEQQLCDDGPGTQWANRDGLARALLAAGEFAEAIPALEIMHEHSSNSHPGALGRQVQLSVCHWMLGKRAQALEIIKGLVNDVRKRKVYYTDFGGGTSYGVILCYMAATLHASTDVNLALQYLKWTSKRRYIHSWPGPAALVLLGQLSFEEALKDGTGVADLQEAKKNVEQPSMERRHLTSLLFAAAVERRLAGDEPGCRAYMAECAGVPNTLCEDEWYLARGEVGAPIWTDLTNTPS
jgi:hypothetical protein